MSGAGKPASYSKLYGIEKPAAQGSKADEPAREPEQPPPAQERPGNDSAEPEAGGDRRQSTGSADQTDDQEPDDQDATDDDDQGDAADGGQDDGGGAGRGRRWAMPSLGGGQIASAGAGWVLGVLLWGWIVLPFVKGGPTQVAATLRAKFLNQSPDGSALP